MTGVNKYISECHDAPVRVAGDSFGEGTNHYVCIECKEPCDFYAEFQKPVPTPPNPNNEIEAELRELKNQLGWLIQRAGEGNENSVKFHREQVLQWVQAHTQEQIRLARIDTEDNSLRTSRLTYIIDMLTDFDRKTALDSRNQEIVNMLIEDESNAIDRIKALTNKGKGDK